MEIMLTYHGPLPACQDEQKHTDQKQIIRWHFSQQLANKFQREPTLVQWAQQGMPEATIVNGRVQLPIVDQHEHCFYEVQTCGFVGTAIVASHNGLGCQLDIEICRREKPGGVLAGGNKGGDIDNRLKPLLDALALPLRPNQVPASMHGNGRRLYCLLEDDSLVSRLSIDIQRWDEEPKSPAEADHVYVRVKATIQPVEPRVYHAGF